MPTLQSKAHFVPATKVNLDGLSVVVVGTDAQKTIAGSLHRAWGLLRKRPAIQRRFRQLQQRFEGTSLTPGMAFLRGPKIPRKIESFLDAHEHSGSPIIYVLHHGSMNAPHIRSRIKVGNADFYVSQKKKFSLTDYENALDVMVGLGETVAIPANDNRIPDDVASDLSELDLEDPKTGRLDAVKIAKCYGIAPSAFAEDVVGVSRQSLLKTPGSANRQQLFRPFAKLARLGIKLLGTKEQFRAWLNAPNNELYEHATPLELIRRGQITDTLALVEDQLLGNPV